MSDNTMAERKSTKVTNDDVQKNTQKTTKDRATWTLHKTSPI